MFSVQWTPAALNELAALWTEADSAERQSLTDATREIDSALRLSPQSAGESRDEPRRILFVPPLGVTFKVQPLDRTVRVLRVWRLRRRGAGA